MDSITYEFLFERVEAAPVEHLGGYAPELLRSYFSGYEHSRYFHGAALSGRLSLSDFNEWFIDNVSPSPSGFAAYCRLKMNSDIEALDLFYALRKLALESDVKNRTVQPPRPEASMLQLIAGETMKKKPALYFGNEYWTTGIWAYWNGYAWAEQDLGITDSADSVAFGNFQAWLEKRYQFAEGVRWGKIFDYLAIGVLRNAWELFYDHLDLFLAGKPTDSLTKSTEDWIAACVADVEERRRRGEL